MKKTFRAVMAERARETRALFAANKAFGGSDKRLAAMYGERNGPPERSKGNETTEPDISKMDEGGTSET